MNRRRLRNLAWRPVPKSSRLRYLAGALSLSLLLPLLMTGAAQDLNAPQAKIGDVPRSADVPWLAEVTTPPAVSPSDNIGRMEPLLVTRDGVPIRTQGEWEVHRKSIRDRWLKFLGPMPDPRPPVSLQVLNQEVLSGLTRRLVRYDSEPGLPVEGYLLIPDGAERNAQRAAIVALHQTTNSSIDEIAGVSGRDAMQIGLKLAKQGYVVFCPRCFLWQNASDLEDAVRQHRERHPQTLGMAKMLYDAMRGVDVLCSLDYVDSTRIGAVGHSLGAKEVLYLAAFDERIRAAAASEGGTGFRSTNWDASWYLGEAIRDKDFPLNHHQLLALIAPRPFLILGGESGPGAADGDRSWPLITAAQPVWQLCDPTIRLGLLNHHEGHTLSPASFDHISQWLETYLKKTE